MNKSLLNNSLYNVLYKLLNVVFPLLSATYVARVILAKGVGEVSYVQNIVSYFTTIAALGIPNYGIREIAKSRCDKVEENKIFTELMFINAISTSLCCVCYLVLIRIAPLFSGKLSLYYAVGILIPFNYLNVDWFYQGNEEYAYIAKRSFVIKLISLLTLFIFVRSETDTIRYALISSIASGSNYIFNIIHLRKYNIKVSIRQLNLKRHLKPIFILFASVIAIELYTMLDTTMIGIFCNADAVGYYTNSMRIVKLLITVVTAIGGVLLPRLSVYWAEGDVNECEKIVNRVFSIMLFIFIPAEMGMILTAPLIMPVLFGNSFIQAVGTLKIAALLICTLGFSNLFGTQVLLTFGEERKLFICTLIGAVSNVFLNAFLIPLYQQNGAALASVVSETLVTVLSIIYSRRYIQISLQKNFIMSVSVATVVMSIAVSRIMRNMDNQVLSLFLSILIGCLCYVTVNIILKNPELVKMKDFLRRKKDV